MGVVCGFLESSPQITLDPTQNPFDPSSFKKKHRMVMALYMTMPSLCGILVYSDETSMLTRVLLGGTLVVVISLMNSDESLM